jgi:hypothetical protein
MKTTLLCPLALTAAAMAVGSPSTLFGQTTNCITRPPGLVAWWTGDDTTRDEVGTNSGTWVGSASYADGLVGKAFAVGDSIVEVLHSPDLSFAPGSEGTFECWAYRTGANMPAHIFGKRESCTGLWGNYQLPVVVDEGLDHWVHWAMVCASNTVSYYTNGVLWEKHDLAFGPENTASLLIGGSGSCQPRFYGLVDELCIYNRALSSDEIGAIVAAGSAGKCKEPIELTIRVSQVEVCWNSRSNDTYQVQYRSDLTTNTWSPLIQCVPGNVSTTCIQDAVLLGQPQRFYRVVLTNCVP